MGSAEVDRDEGMKACNLSRLKDRMVRVPNTQVTAAVIAPTQRTVVASDATGAERVGAHVSEAVATYDLRRVRGSVVGLNAVA
jgi:hypothetical protein